MKKIISKYIVKFVLSFSLIFNQNYLSLMQKYTHREKFPDVLDTNLCPIKISNFDLPIEEIPLLRHRYSLQEKISKRRQMVQTPFSQRSKQSHVEIDRKAHTSQDSRLSHYVQCEIQKLSKEKNRMSQFTPLVKQKMSELHSIMQMKSLALQNSPLKQKRNVSFTQYKINALRPVSQDESSILHSRLKKQCPFMKTVKARKILSKSEEPRNNKTQLYKSIELNKDSKYGKSKKMILIGGSLSSRISATANPQKYDQGNSPMRDTRTTSHSRNYVMRRIILKNRIKASQFDDGVDCKPWQTIKIDNLNQEYNGLQM